MLEAIDLKLSYGHIDAVRGAAFVVKTGQVAALIGANGAGKSTILKAVSGALRPGEGAILWNGKVISGLPSYELVKLGIVHVPEGRQIFSRLSVAENLKIGAYSVRDKRKIADTTEYVFDLFPILKERVNQPSGVLSGGEQQMLAIARGLMAQPKLLLLDEPTLGLSPIYVRKVMDVVARLRELKITILLVEQNVDEALRVSDKTYLIESGEIVRSAATDAQIQDSYLGGAGI